MKLTANRSTTPAIYNLENKYEEKYIGENVFWDNPRRIASKVLFLVQICFADGVHFKIIIKGLCQQTQMEQSMSRSKTLKNTWDKKWWRSAGMGTLNLAVIINVHRLNVFFPWRYWQKETALRRLLVFWLCSKNNNKRVSNRLGYGIMFCQFAFTDS